MGALESNMPVSSGVLGQCQDGNHLKGNEFRGAALCFSVLFSGSTFPAT
jgi:hypothetical protein